MGPKGTTRRTRTWRRSIPAVVDDNGVVSDAGVLDGDVSIHDGIYCASCRVPATSVKAHPGRDGRGAVAAYFRIKHQGDRHAVGCEYDFDRQVKLIVAEAGAEVISKERGRYRLHLPLTSEPERRDDGTSAGSDPHEVEWKVLSAAARIQQLLNRYQRHPEAVEEFAAEYKGREIGWGDFCWDVTKPGRAHELLNELRRPDWQQDWHPMAVWSWNTGHVTGDDGDSFRLTLTRAHEEGAVARLRSESAGAFNNLDPAHRCVMGYGRWETRPVVDVRRPQLVLRVGHASAVTSWPIDVWPPRAWMHRQAPARSSDNSRNHF